MAAVLKDESRSYIVRGMSNKDLLGSPPLFFSTYPFGDVAEPIRFTPFLLVFYSHDVPGHDPELISRSGNMVQISPRVEHLVAQVSEDPIEEKQR